MSCRTLFCGCLWLGLATSALSQQAQRFPVVLSPNDGAIALAGREDLLSPGVDRSASNVASATRAPWLDANGWQLLRNPTGEYYYDLSRGQAVLAMAEAFAYNADAILKIHPADAEDAARMLAFLQELPPANLPTIADIGVVDDDSDEIAEVMNLLSRRNLLFKVVGAPAPELKINIKLGTDEFSFDDAGDPSEFAQMVRAKLGDDNRALRIYGSETVICHWTGDGMRTRLHLLNYTGRSIGGLRVRLRGQYGAGTAAAFGHGALELEEIVRDETAIEFTLVTIGVYAAVDLVVAGAAGD